MTGKSQPIFVKSKTGRLIELPTPEENEAINAGIAADPDTFELTDEWVAKARRVGRPVSETPKIKRSIRFSVEVISYFRATGKGWQTRMDHALKEWISMQKR
ncbi:MAG: BrnA antitoxin family protein [Alphaproteobacteria bacterium]